MNRDSESEWAKERERRKAWGKKRRFERVRERWPLLLSTLIAGINASDTPAPAETQGELVRDARTGSEGQPVPASPGSAEGGSLRGRCIVIVIITKGPAEGMAVAPELVGLAVGGAQG